MIKKQRRLKSRRCLFNSEQRAGPARGGTSHITAVSGFIFAGNVDKGIFFVPRDRSDLFRIVRSRKVMRSFPFPETAISSSGNMKKRSLSEPDGERFFILRMRIPPNIRG